MATYTQASNILPAARILHFSHAHLIFPTRPLFLSLSPPPPPFAFEPHNGIAPRGTCRECEFEWAWLAPPPRTRPRAPIQGANCCACAQKRGFLLELVQTDNAWRGSARLSRDALQPTLVLKAAPAPISLSPKAAHGSPSESGEAVLQFSAARNSSGAVSREHELTFPSARRSR